MLRLLAETYYIHVLLFIPVEQIPDYRDDLSTRILRQAQYQQEIPSEMQDGGENTRHSDHFVTDPDQPKLALVDSVQPTREKRPISGSEVYNGGIMCNAFV